MTKNQRNTLIVAITTAFVTTYMGSSLNLAVPNIERAFSVGAAAVGWVITIYMLAVSALAVPLGKIADMTDRRKILIGGIGLFSATGLCALFANTLWILLAIRLIQGIAAAMIFSTNNAILISAFPSDMRGSVLGKSTAATYIGLSAGPVLGGLLNDMFGWKSIFASSFIISLVACIIAVKGLETTEKHSTENARNVTAKSFDLPGSLTFIGMVIFTLIGLANLSVKSSSPVWLGCGILLGVLFVMIEKRRQDPIIRIDMFTGDRVFSFSNIAAFLNYCATFAIGYLLSIYLQIIIGYSSRIAGLILITQPLVQAFVSPYAGMLSDRIAAHKIASGGMGLCAVALLMLSFIGTDTQMWYIFLIMIICGTGMACFSAPNVNTIMSRVKGPDYSVANSIVATMRNLGQSSGMAIITIVMGMTIGNISLESAGHASLVGAMRISFTIFLAMCILGTIFSLARSKR